jgi:hypothetical protein
MVMHPSRTAAVAAAFWLALSLAHPASSQARPVPGSKAADALDQARQRLTGHDAPGAAALLESALPGAAGGDRAALLGLLRQAYEAAARQAETAGKADSAESYRDNLAILDRAARRATGTTTTNPPAAGASRSPSPEMPPASPETRLPSRPLIDPRAIRAGDEPSAIPGTVPQGGVAWTVAPRPSPRETPADVAAGPRPTQPAPGGLVSLAPPTGAADAAARTAPAPVTNATPPPAATTAPPTAAPAPPGAISVAAADSAFLAKRYDVAGSIYAALDRQKALPADRRNHWAYCRAVEVVRRINARPVTAREWAAIDAEIEEIRRLSPTNWFAEYLRNRAAERNPGAHNARAQSDGKVVVRGSSPDEGPASAPAAPRVSPPPAAPSGLPRAAVPVPTWSPQPVYTTNFQIEYVEGQRDLAERVGKAAEDARATLVKRWGETNPGLPWSPRCEIRLFSTAGEFSRVTGQPPESPGISTIRMTDGRIDGRRINLRTDHPNIVRAVLPHEVTHVVLADLFPQKQIPRWADEGMAVLSEPPSEQNVRAADLTEPLAVGQLFRLNDLVAMDYPDPRYLPLYYAQSVSLTRFLVEQGNPAQFIKLVQQAQWSGFEPALKQVYEISDFGELQTKWLTFAKAKSSSVLTATSDRDPAVTPVRR